MVRRRRTETRAALHARLDELVRTTDGATRRDDDPVGIVHDFDEPLDQEIVGLLASSLAFGRVTSIRQSIRRVLAVVGAHPASYVHEHDEASLAQSLNGFVHRVHRGEHVARLLARAGTLQRSHGSLGHAFGETLRAHDGDFELGLIGFADALRGPDPDRGMRHLMPDPRAGSACKRLLLFLRWMIRPADGVDLGLWREVGAEHLLIPVDTHVHRIARNLGLTDRADASLRTSREITATLRTFCAEDPVRYDFAICHLGVSRSCPSRRDPELCGQCVLRDVCRHWLRS